MDPFGILPTPIFAAAVLAIVILVATWARKRAGINLVIQRWHASNEPDEHGRFVAIEGRSAGILMWMLAQLGIDTTSGISVSETSVRFTEVSLAGPRARIIPLSRISATLFSYHKPWLAALVVLAVVGKINWVLPEAYSDYQWVAWLLGALLAFLYYLLNRKLTLGFTEASGVTSFIQFRRSVIENQEITPLQADYVCVLIQSLIENDRILLNPSPTTNSQALDEATA